MSNENFNLDFDVNFDDAIWPEEEWSFVTNDEAWLEEETPNEETHEEETPEPTTFIHEMNWEADALEKEAEAREKRAEKERLEEEAINVALENYERSQLAFDHATVKLQEAVSNKNAAESRARARIAAMRASRAANISHVEFLRREKEVAQKAIKKAFKK